MRIPEGHKIVNTYIKKFGLTPTKFNGSDDNGMILVINNNVMKHSNIN